MSIDKKKQLYTSVPLYIRQHVLAWWLALPAKERKRLQSPPPPTPPKKRTRKKRQGG